MSTITTKDGTQIYYKDWGNGQPVVATAGRSVRMPAIPSWYLVATEDHAITPELQRFMAQRIGAKTSEVKASHVPFVSQPKTVAGVIEQAASAVQ